ncbi:serine/arginine-rich splicing factor 11-like isoform X1 [Osmerus mordax]|uniref:serine/arginine-rich splicing factor 11-like isoform X1 n=1 Tax=Osmerus mordax TaxID=8014 RepID=UPI00350F22DA
MNSNTNVVQVTNVSPSTTSEQMRTLFGFLGNIEDLKLFPPDESPLPVTSRVCFVKFHESESVGVSQHLTNTVFVDRALIVVPFAEGVIPDESKALSLLAPANAVAGILPGGGLLPTPNPLMGGSAFGGLGGPNMECMSAMGMAGANMNPQALSADFLKLMQSMDPKMNPMAAGLNLNSGMKTDASNKEIEEAMKRVREAQSLISAAIEPGNKSDKRKHSRSPSRSRRRRSGSRSRHRRSKSRSRRRSQSKNRRRSRSPRRRRSHSRDKSRRSKSRDRRKEEKLKKRSKTPPKSYSSARRSRSISRRRRRSRSASRSPKKSRSPKRKLSKSPSPRRHKKEKKKDKEREKDRGRERKDRDQSRDERERSTSKKKKNKDKDRKSDGEKGDVKVWDKSSVPIKQVTRDYDEEEQGYDSGKEGEVENEEETKSDSDSSPKPQDVSAETPEGQVLKKSKLNGDDHHQEDMEMSD